MKSTLMPLKINAHRSLSSISSNFRLPNLKKTHNFLCIYTPTIVTQRFFFLRIATMVSKLVSRELTYIHKVDEALFGTLQTFNLLLQSTHLRILISYGCVQGLKPPHNFLEPLNLRGKYVSFNLYLLKNVKIHGKCKYFWEQWAPINFMMSFTHIIGWYVQKQKNTNILNWVIYVMLHLLFKISQKENHDEFWVN